LGNKYKHRLKKKVLFAAFRQLKRNGTFKSAFIACVPSHLRTSKLTGLPPPTMLAAANA